MQVELAGIGKRFKREWIFRDINLTLTPDHAYVISGANGSGKSTLLQVIAGSLMPSTGSVTYSVSGKPIEQDSLYKQVTLSTPYMTLYEDMTLKEAIEFHVKFKRMRLDEYPEALAETIGLSHAFNKQLKAFSSGMRQRVKLGLAILSDTPLLLLDEPTAFLDKNAIEWYRNLIESHRTDRLVVVCSNNQKDEFFFCDQAIQIEDYKLAGKAR